MGFLDSLIVWAPSRDGTWSHALNLRVVAEEHGGNLRFRRALMRTGVKLLLGWFSFLWMAATRKHQALHDLAARSTVQIRDLSKAKPWQYTTQRDAPSGHAGSSTRRRVIAIVGYSIALLVLLSVTATELWISESCFWEDVCTPADDFVEFVVALVWLGGTAVIVTLGWKGALPGSRGAGEDLER